MIESFIESFWNTAVCSTFGPRREILNLWSVELLDSSCNAVAGVRPGESVIANGYMRITVPSINLDPSQSLWTLDSGTYFLRFIPNSVDVFREPFIFHTSYAPHYGHGFKSAEPIDIPGSINGALLYPMDREVFRFTLSEPTAIHAWTTGTTSLLVLPPINLGFADLSSARTSSIKAHKMKLSQHFWSPVHTTCLPYQQLLR